MTSRESHRSMKSVLNLYYLVSPSSPSKIIPQKSEFFFFFFSPSGNLSIPLKWHSLCDKVSKHIAHTFALWVHLTRQEDLSLQHDLIEDVGSEKQRWCYLKGIAEHSSALLSHLRCIMAFPALPGFVWWPSPGILCSFEVPGNLIWIHGIHGITLTMYLRDFISANLGVVQYPITGALTKVYLKAPC